MLDLGISKMALIGAVALIVIGPEKLPRVARTVGTLLGKAQRYVADVKAEVNRAMDVDELKKMKETVESAGREVEQGIRETSASFEKDWSEATAGLDAPHPDDPLPDGGWTPAPEYRRPNKNWRVKRGATPQWYKARQGVRRQVQSGAARVARTVGTLLGKAQRYVADVKAEVNRSMELDELRKMKEQVESAARDVEQSVQTEARAFEKDWSEATAGLTSSETNVWESADFAPSAPQYKHPGKNWRLKRGAVPRWYKARAGVRTHVQSGAARVARFRPKKKTY